MGRAAFLASLLAFFVAVVCAPLVAFWAAAVLARVLEAIW